MPVQGEVATPNERNGSGAASVRPRLTKYAWLSIAAAITTIGLKTGAFLITGSVGLLSDAAESLVNLVAAVMALVALSVAARPPDESHNYGHGKVEYFSAGLEGLLIFVASAAIMATSINRFLNPQELQSVGIGLVISGAATGVNLAVGLLLVRVGTRHRSLTLTADGKHLLTDVWTSAGVIVAVLLVPITGWVRLDPIIAFVVALNILVMGTRLLARSVGGLMDAALPAVDNERIAAAIRPFATDEVHFHGLQTRESGHVRFVSLHVLVPGAWLVQRGHDVLEEVEAAICAALPDAVVHTHLEPLEDNRSYEDALGSQPLDI